MSALQGVVAGAKGDLVFGVKRGAKIPVAMDDDLDMVGVAGVELVSGGYKSAFYSCKGWVLLQ